MRSTAQPRLWREPFSGSATKILSFRRGSVPENLGDVPGAVAVVDQQSVTEWLQLVERTYQRLGRRPLHKRTGLGIDRSAQEIVGLRVANVEADGGIEGHELNEIRLAKWARFIWRLRGQRRGANLFNRLGGSYVEEMCGIGTGIYPDEMLGEVRKSRNGSVGCNPFVINGGTAARLVH